MAGLWVGALMAFSAQQSLGYVMQQDTTMPNRFEFTQAEYVVAEDATNAVITVRFYPGNRGIAGSVGYTSEDVTAIASTACAKRSSYLPKAVGSSLRRRPFVTSAARPARN